MATWGFQSPHPKPLSRWERGFSQNERELPRKGRGWPRSVSLPTSTTYNPSPDQQQRGATSPNLPGKERSTETEERFIWAPAGDGFSGWPDDLAGFRLLDPCCGSGHFLVAAFSMLVPMRMELEGLSARGRSRRGAAGKPEWPGA